MNRRLLWILLALSCFVAATILYRATTDHRTLLQDAAVEATPTSIGSLEAPSASSAAKSGAIAAPDRREALNATAETSEPSPSTSAAIIRIPIRSAYGVPLRNIERSPDGVKWDPGGGSQGEILFREGEAARWYRAAGHAAQQVQPTDEAAVLESDLVISFHAEGLAGSIRNAVVVANSWKNWQQVFAAHGAVGDDAYSFAIAPEYGRKVFTGPVGLELHLLDHMRLRVEPDWDARGVHRIDVGDLLDPTDSADVQVIARCAHEGADVRIECLKAEPALELQPTRQGVWGRLLKGGTRLPDQQKALVGAELRFVALPVGVEHLLLGRCANRCIGRTFVVPSHAQPTVELLLTAPARVSGSLRAARGERQPQDFELAYQLSDSPVFDLDVDADYEGSRRMTCEADCRFELELPDRASRSPSAAWPPPRYAHLEWLAGGFQSAQRTVDLHDPRSCELGVVELEPLEPHLVISSGHGVAQAVLRSSLQLALSGEIALDVESLTPGSNGELLVFLRRALQTDEALSRWRKLPTAHALLTGGSISYYPFERTNDGRLQRLPIVRANCDFYVNREPPALGAFHYGYRWNGIDHVTGKVGHEDVGTSFTLQLNLPDGPLDIWWNTEPAPPAAGMGGWAELRDGRAKLMIE